MQLARKANVPVVILTICSDGLKRIMSVCQRRSKWFCVEAKTSKGRRWTPPLLIFARDPKMWLFLGHRCHRQWFLIHRCVPLWSELPTGSLTKAIVARRTMAADNPSAALTARPFQLPHWWTNDRDGENPDGLFAPERGPDSFVRGSLSMHEVRENHFEAEIRRASFFLESIILGSK